MQAAYITQGAIRGRCSHSHRTLQGAIQCLDRDMQDCAAQGGYSDRSILRRTASGHIVSLNMEERADLEIRLLQS